MPASEQGSAAGRYTLIPRTLIFLTRGKRVLLLKGAAHKRLWANRYNGVGGHVERGEDILRSAQRELLEETGLSAGLWLCGVITVDTGPNPGIGIFILRGEADEGEATPSEEGTLEWVDSAAISRLPLVEDLYILLPRVLQLRRGDAPLIGHYDYDAEGKMRVFLYEG